MLSLKAFASNPLSTFYTDDSSYYQKLYKDGFALRFRVAKSECSQIKSSEVILNLNSNAQYPLALKELTASELANWPDLYQLNPKDFCWYGGRVRGQDLNSPILYGIKIKTKGHGDLFLNAAFDSILPAKRLKKSITHWMVPGAVGATPLENGGTLFKVWEPEAERVDLIINQKKTYQLNPPATFQNLHFLYLPSVKEGDEYALKFVKNGEYEVLEVGNDGLLSAIKVDPMAKRLTYDKKGGSINGYKNPRAIVTGHSKYNWKNDQQVTDIHKKDIEPWLIYQLWPLTFNPKEMNGKYRAGTFDDVAEKVDYFSSLGVTAVEFLPVHESRFHASWGYALDTLTLIEKNYGSQDSLRNLVDKLHQKDLRVIFDVVINHVNNSLIRDPLSKTRFNTKFYRGNTPWGPKPDFKNIMVKKWIADSLANLVRDYHVDGLRFDMIEAVYVGSKAGYEFVQDLNTLLKKVQPTIYLSAEQLPDNAWATFPVSDNGLGFDSQWNDKFKNFFELKFDHYNEFQRFVDFSPLKGSLMGFSNHDSGSGEYHFGGATRTLNYLGSHDFVGNKNPFMRIISSFESYESVGKNYIFRVRPLEIPDEDERFSKFRLIHNEFTHSASLTSYGILFTKPGAAMFFQGEELAGDLNIENEWSYIDAKENNSIPTKDVDMDRYVRSHRVQWEYLDPFSSPELNFLTRNEKESFKRYHRAFKDLIALRKRFPGIDLNDAHEVKDCAPNVLCYRLNRGPEENFVLVNYGHDISESWIQFPGTTVDYWEESFSLASSEYSSGRRKFLNIIPNIGGRSNNVRIAGPSIIVFTKTRTASISEPLFFRSNINAWEARGLNQLRKASDKGDIYMTQVTVEQTQEIEFKLGSKDWSIDLGSPKKGSQSTPFLGPTEGFLSYLPEQENATIELGPGVYHFLFNIRDFKYRFLKVKEL
jgi:1,4-alpha-glucan branching enzyme